MSEGSNRPKVIIFHGLGGSPSSAWIPWLRRELEARGYEVVIPRFPHPWRFYAGALLKNVIYNLKTPVFADWLAVFESYGVTPDVNTVLVAHSLGGAFVLKLLEHLSSPVRATVLVAAPAGLGRGRLYRAAREFTDGFSYDWSRIKANIGSVTVFQGDADRTVDPANGRELAARLGADLVSLPGAGHSGTVDGRNDFPLLLDKIERLLK
jgi:predicted alpha/beta hydrolase family esterase